MDWQVLLLMVCVLILFFLMPRTPTSSTLFPYTALFRSHDFEPGDLRESDHRLRRLQGRARIAQKDRKSTRLNSSHVAISYAVFCLKKKTSGHPPCGVVPLRTQSLRTLRICRRKLARRLL